MKALILSLFFFSPLLYCGPKFQADRSISEPKTVLLAILARNKAHVLPTYLKCIDNLDYDKKLVTVYVNSNNNDDTTKEILEEWVKKNKKYYRHIEFDHHTIEKMPATNPHDWASERWSILGKIRQQSLMKTKEYKCDYYFVADCDNFVIPSTLKLLISKDKPIIAPLLRAIPQPNDPYSNYFYDVTDSGYYKDHPHYFKIFNREQIGTFKVPVVHQVYLVKSECIDKLSYGDVINEWEFIIFSRNARKNQVDQYICNEEEFGTFLHFAKNLSLQEEQAAFQQILEKRRELRTL